MSSKLDKKEYPLSVMKRLKKAKQNHEGQLTVSPGVKSKIVNSAAGRTLINQKNKYKKIRKELIKLGFSKIKIVNQKYYSAVFKGQLLKNDHFVAKIAELDI